MLTERERGLIDELHARFDHSMVRVEQLVARITLLEAVAVASRAYAAEGGAAARTAHAFLGRFTEYLEGTDQRDITPHEIKVVVEAVERAARDHKTLLGALAVLNGSPVEPPHG